jgi:hypothetical protein
MPLRQIGPGEEQLSTPHPLPITVACIAEAIRRMRTIGATQADANDEIELWRGLRDMRVPKEFLVNGGTELAPMSTTTDLNVALKYGTSETSIILKLRTTSFMQRGADLSWVSAFPAESECLFPPLTYLEPTSGKPEKVVASDEAGEQATYYVVEVTPHFGS